MNHPVIASLVLPVFLLLCPRPAGACSCDRSRRDHFAVVPQDGQTGLPCTPLLAIQTSQDEPAVVLAADGLAHPFPGGLVNVYRPPGATHPRAGTWRRLRVTTVSVTRAGRPVALRVDSALDHGYQRTTLLRPIAPLVPSSDHVVVWKVEASGGHRTRTVKFRTGACGPASPVVPPAHLGLSMVAGRADGPSCGSGMATAFLAFQPGRAGTDRAPLHALYFDTGALTWRKPSAYVIAGEVPPFESAKRSPLATEGAYLGQPGSCSRQASAPLPEGRRVRIGVRAVGPDGTLSVGVSSAPVIVPRTRTFR